LLRRAGRAARPPPLGRSPSSAAAIAELEVLADQGDVAGAARVALLDRRRSAAAIAIAGFVIARDGGGRLWCTSSGDQMMIRLPVA
jgi:hypothetical protein